MARDMTLKQKISDLENQLQRVQETAVRETYRQSPIPTLLANRSDAVIEYNDAMVRLTGFVHAEVSYLDDFINQVAFDIQVRQEVADIGSRSLFCSDVNSRSRLAITTKAGELRYLAISAFEMKDPTHLRDLLIVQAEDITEFHMAYLALKDSEKNLKAILNNSLDGVTRLNRQHQHIFVNSIVSMETGVSPEQYLGKTNEEIGFPKEMCDLIRSKHEEVFRTGRSVQYEFVFDGKLRGRQHLQVISSPEINEEGRVETLVDTLRDISALKQAHAEKDSLIAELRNALEEIRTLKGILPICSNCNQIRDQEGSWERIEDYIEKRSHAKFSHGLCPKCVAKLYPDLDLSN